MIKIKNNLFSQSLILALFFFIVFLPFAHAGFWVGDDLLNSQIHANLALNKQSFWYLLLENIRFWYHSGRIDILGFFLIYGTYYVFHTLAAYKIARIFWVLAGYFSCSLLVYQITRVWKSALLFLILIPMLWLFPVYHTALLSYVPLFPAVTVFISTSLIFFLKYLESKKYYLLLLSLFFYLCALATREVSLSTLLLMGFFSLVHISCWKKRILTLLPAVLMTCIYLLIVFYGRHHADATMYVGLKLGNFHDFFLAFLKQFTAALPLSPYIFTWHGLIFFAGVAAFTTFYLLSFKYLSPITQNILKSCFIGVVLLILCLALPNPLINAFLGLVLFIISFILIYQWSEISFTKPATRDLLTLGITLAVFPAVLVSISFKYQHDFNFGMGYLPLYVQNAGMVILTMIGISRGLQNSFDRVLLSLLLSGIIVFVFFANNSKVLWVNQTTKYPRELLQTAYKNGILNGISPNQSIITFISPDSSINTQDLIYESIRKKFTVISSIAAIDSTKSKLPAIYLIDVFAIPRSYAAGYVLLNRVSSATANKTKKIFTGVQLFCLAKTAQDVYDINLILSRVYNIKNSNTKIELSCSNTGPINLTGLSYSRN